MELGGDRECIGGEIAKLGVRAGKKISVAAFIVSAVTECVDCIR